MNKLEKVFPNDNLYLSYIYALSMSMLLFGLSWMDLLIMLAIDTAMFMVFSPIDLWGFYRFFPRFMAVKNFDEEVKKRANSPTHQKELFDLMAEFPEVRSSWLFFIGLFKVLPVGVYISYVSKTSSYFLENLFLYYVADVFILIYVHGLLFIQLNHMASDMMGELRTVSGWSENYRDLRLTRKDDRFSLIQNSLLVAMLINLLWIALHSTRLETVNTNYYLLILFASAIICIGNIQLMFQNYFKKSLKAMCELIDQDIVSKKLKALPLHTSPILAGFEYTFNQLGLKLEQRDEEISQWLKHESEQFHLRSLGEVAALVAHDIKTPLHVMQMSLDMIRDPEATPSSKEKYHQILEKNLTQTISFTQTLMAYLKGSRENVSCRFGEIHDHLVELFRTQFLEDEFKKINFNLSPELLGLNVRVNRLDAMHIFYNIYQNAIKSLLNSDQPSPSLTLWSELDEGESQVQIFIKDNGPGLGVDDFNQMVSFERFQNERFYKGLGLRLTHTILNHVQGHLSIVPVDQGTCLKVSLPTLTNTADQVALS